MQTEPRQERPVENLEVRVASAIEKIKGWSASAFKNAELQPKEDEYGRRFIEHGAMCYANCFLMLQRVLDGSESGD